ncbi:MAG: polyphosphate kinase 2 family protein [Ignavibacteriales bacterium]
MNIKPFLVKPDTKVSLSKYRTDDTNSFKSKSNAQDKLDENIAQMAELQSKLYAQDKLSLLIIFQALDGGGKDSTIKHVMTGLNPQGTQVFSFKQPSKGELDHDYLWRISKSLPEKGRIGIFNRSHYEEVLVVRVHNLLEQQKIPDRYLNDNIWKMRYRQINDFERYLYETGTYILKFHLHISKEEQRKRFLKRIEDPGKNWKISDEDMKERDYWDDYQKCYQDAISATSTRYAPWYIIPGDKKWFARLAVSEVIVQTLDSMNLSYPKISREQEEKLQKMKEKLLSEAHEGDKNGKNNDDK